MPAKGGPSFFLLDTESLVAPLYIYVKFIKLGFASILKYYSLLKAEAKTPTEEPQMAEGQEKNDDEFAKQTRNIFKQFMYKRLTSQIEEEANEGDMSVGEIPRTVFNQIIRESADDGASTEEQKLGRVSNELFFPFWCSHLMLGPCIFVARLLYDALAVIFAIQIKITIFKLWHLLVFITFLMFS